jgi:hypothetical protein
VSKRGPPGRPWIWKRPRSSSDAPGLRSASPARSRGGCSRSPSPLAGARRAHPRQPADGDPQAEHGLHLGRAAWLDADLALDRLEPRHVDGERVGIRLEPGELEAPGRSERNARGGEGDTARTAFVPLPRDARQRLPEHGRRGPGRGRRASRWDPGTDSAQPVPANPMLAAAFGLVLDLSGRVHPWLLVRNGQANREAEPPLDVLG